MHWNHGKRLTQPFAGGTSLIAANVGQPDIGAAGVLSGFAPHTVQTIVTRLSIYICRKKTLKKLGKKLKFETYVNGEIDKLQKEFVTIKMNY